MACRAVWYQQHIERPRTLHPAESQYKPCIYLQSPYNPYIYPIIPMTPIWGFPKIGGPFLGVPRIRTVVLGVYIGVPLFRGTTI